MLPRLLFSCVVLCVFFGGVRPRCGLVDVFWCCIVLCCVALCVVLCCGVLWYIVVYRGISWHITVWYIVVYHGLS